MATWKKVIVSGSDAELNTLFTSFHITSSANISASGFLYGNLPIADHEYTVVYNTGTGRLERTILNLVATKEAPNLFLADSNNDSTYDYFRVSHAPGETNLLPSVTPYFELSASLLGDGNYDISIPNNFAMSDGYGVNTKWIDEIDNDQNSNTTFYGIPAGGSNFVNITGSVSGSRNGLKTGTTFLSMNISLNSVDNNENAVPDYGVGATEGDDTTFNYLAKSFVDGGIGELRIFLNDNTTPHTIIDFESSGDELIGATGNPVELSYNFSPTRSNADGAGNEDTSKHARSGSYQVLTGGQRDGYNFTYAIHTGSKDGEDFQRITNFVEWFYDADGASYNLEDLGVTEVTTINGFNANETSSISGIRFFNENAADNVRYQWTGGIRNQYRNIYLSTNQAIKAINVSHSIVDYIEVTQSNSNILQTGLGANYYQQIDNIINSDTSLFFQGFLKDLQGVNETTTDLTVHAGATFTDIQGDFYQPSDFLSNFTSNTISSLDNVFNFDLEFNHIPSHKNVDSLELPGISVTDYLVNTLTVNANEYQFEDFRGEQFRIVSRSYAVGDVSGLNTTYNWDGTKNVINGGDGFNSGSIVYYSHLLYPNKAGDDGVFTTLGGPNLLQPNYSSTTGEREYFRYFKFTSNANGKRAVNIELVGSGKVVPEGNTTNFTTNGDGMKLQVWRTGLSNNTLYSGQFLNALDHSISVGNDLTNSEYIPLATTAGGLDYDGASFNIPGTSTYVPTGVIKFSDDDGETFNENDLLIVRIIVPQGWTGYLNAMAIHLGNAAPTNGSILGYSPYTAL